jgi:DNA-binding CsgD family transcriptional regulator
LVRTPRHLAQRRRGAALAPFVIRHIFEAVPTLAARDAKRLLRFVSHAEELGDEEAFAAPVLEELGRLIPAALVGYDEKDVAAGRCLLSHEYPSFETVYGPFDFAAAAAADNPLRGRQAQGRVGAVRLSDLFSRPALRRTSYHHLVLEPLGVTAILTVAIRSPPTHVRRFGFDRVDGRFSERDRLVLDVLRPHLERLWRNAETRRRLRAAIAGLEWATEQDPKGVVLLAAGGRVEFSSPAASRLVRTYFPTRTDGVLATALSQWLESGSSTLVRRQADRLLTIRRVGDALLLEETREDPPLTPREREIVALLARGKTNTEIAEVLWVAPSTVRKHLENIYAKLGVHTRTAAVTRVHGLVDDDIGPA